MVKFLKIGIKTHNTHSKLQYTITSKQQSQ